MVGVDPIRRGLNGYPYCNNEPTDYVDPTGEALNILGGGLLGGIIGAGAGFVSSAVSQSLTGQKVDWKKAVGSAVNGAITGAVQGAMIGSGVGLGVSLAANFAAGTLGSAAEQKISTGTVDVTRAVTGGVANAVGNAIYGTGKLNSLKEAVVKGDKAGAAIAGIYYVGEHLNPTNGSSYSEIESRTYTGTYLFPSKQYVTDPRSSCGATSPMISSITSTRAVGYQYSNVQKSESAQKSNGFSLGGLVKEMLIGGLTGGLASGTFYGVDKATRAVAGSITDVRKSGSKAINPNDIRFSQSSVKGASEIIDSMKAKGWDGAPIDVVRMPDGNLTTIDKTRVLAARYVEIDVQVNGTCF